ncbi:MAG TPA: class II aldolase/adducin family protein [Chloroflexota bacterium]
MADIAELKEKVVLAREFLLHEGLIQRYGHISCYVPDEDMVLFTPNASAVRGRLRTGDIVCTDLDGNVVGNRRARPLEWIIHTAVHRARKDALAVIHTHPLFSTSLTIAGHPIRPVYMHGAILGPEPVPVYDDPCVITTPEQAARLIEVLGTARAAELRGHGSVVLGESMERAFAAAIFLEENSKRQLYATLAGHVTYMTADEIERTGPNISQTALEGLWDYYVDQWKLGWH